jgi:hypothetical protein
VIGTDCIGSCKSNYDTITTMKGPTLYLSRVSVMVLNTIFQLYHSG